MNPNISRNRRARAAQSRENRAEDGKGNRSRQGSRHDVNVGEIERQVSMIGGTVLAVCGLLRGSLSGLGLAAIGGALIWRGHTGHCDVYHMVGYDSTEGSSAGGKERHSDNTGHHAERQSLHHEESHAGG